MKKVTPDELKGGEVLAIPVYDKGKGRKLLEAGFPLDTARVEKLKEMDVDCVSVLEEDHKVTSTLPAGADKTFPDYPPLELLKLPDCPAKTIYLEVYNSLKHIFNDYILDKNLEVNHLMNIVSRMIANISADGEVFLQLAALRGKDDYTLFHSINVSILALNLGIGLGLSANELIHLGVGSLVHDLGKLNMPRQIITKRGPLDDAEKQIIKKHPVIGYERLTKSPLAREPLAVVLNHHERCNGSGYPRGIGRRDLDILSRCVAIADVYDALTTDRSYRNKYLPHDALEILMAQSSANLIDANILEVFIKGIMIYPPGSIVKLSDGRLAQVINCPKGLPMRPNVRILNPEHTTAPVVALANNPTILITDIVKIIG